MQRLKVTVDRNADLKALRKLEADGLLELYVVAIEGFEDTGKVKNKVMPVAVADSPFSRIGSSRIAADDTSYRAIQRIVGKQNHGDCIHLEAHIASGRELFVTDDNDFLSKKEELKNELGVEVATVTELQQRFAKG